MSSQHRVEALEQEVAQLRAEAQSQAAASEYLKSRLAQDLHTVELAKKQLMLLEMQQLEIQSLRNQVSNLKAQLEFSQDREARLEQYPPEPERILTPPVPPSSAEESTPAARSGPSLPAFLRRPVASAKTQDS